MAAELARNPWGIVSHHQQQGILELRWLPSTAGWRRRTASW
jgi:hypothetical protein